jgi:ABC-type nitrate/sulfonate/bicarbonate transport system permease component
MNRLLIRTAQALALPIALVALWWWASDASTNFYFPPLSEIVRIFPDTWLSGGARRGGGPTSSPAWPGSRPGSLWPRSSASVAAC